MSQISPSAATPFSFGIWGAGHSGHDPFGPATRTPPSLEGLLELLTSAGATGIGFHDDDLVGPDASWGQRQQAVARLQRALDGTGLTASMATTNLFSHPAFKEGAFTANDQAVRRVAIRKAMDGIDLAVEVGAPVYVFWGGREGVDAPASKDPVAALSRYREAIDFLSGYVREQGYDVRFAIEPKPNEPRGDLFLPTVGHVLAFIGSLEHPEMVGVNPEVAHEHMAGLSIVHAVAQAQWAGKLFHIDLNAQKMTRFDQDLRFGSEQLKEAFFLVRQLERGGYAGPRHFDARPYRTETEAGIADFARGCVRTYELLAEKARRFDDDPEVTAALAAVGADRLDEPTVGPYDPASAEALRADRDRASLDELAQRGGGHERLDQLVIEHLLGAR